MTSGCTCPWFDGGKFSLRCRVIPHASLGYRQVREAAIRVARQLPATVHEVNRAMLGLVDNGMDLGKAEEILLTGHLSPAAITALVEGMERGIFPLQLRPQGRNLWAAMMEREQDVAEAQALMGIGPWR